jgi:hypothetical protein
MTKSHKRNHYIPKCILQFWKSEIETKSVVNYYDCREKVKSTSLTTGRKAYKFAIIEDLYVPFVNGDRNVFMESELLHSLEDKLIYIARHFHYHQGDLPLKTEEEIYQIEMAFISMSLRSRYNICQFIEYVNIHPDLKEELSINIDDDSKKIILEMIINQIHDLTLKYHPIEIIVYYFSDGGLIYCDRPNIIIDGFQCLGLTNKVFLMYRKGDSFRFKYVTGSNNHKFFFNYGLALNSRDWIISEKEELLNQSIEIINSKRWDESVKSDKIIHEKYQFIQEGWQFN